MTRLALLSLFIVLIAANASVSADTPTKQDDTVTQAEIAFWNSIKDTKEASEFEAYLKAFPNGQFAALAKLRLKKLKVGTRPTSPQRKGMPKSPVELVEEKANAGNLEAMTALADSYRWGNNGVEKDLRKSLAWRLKAAETGDVEALYKAGEFYVYGLYELEKKRDWRTAVKWYQRAADKGHSRAMRGVAHAYLHGLGVSKNIETAVRWHKKAADLGDIDSMWILGLMNEQGEEIPKDLAASFEWYRKAVDGGNLHAFFSLGAMYESGAGAPKDPQQAAYYFFRGFATPMRGHFDQYFDRALKWSLATRKALQQRLADAGLYQGTIDGKLGRGTKRALKDLPLNMRGKTLHEAKPAAPTTKPSPGQQSIQDLEKLD